MELSRRNLLIAGAALPFLHISRGFAAGQDKLVFGLSTYPPSLSLWTQVGTAATTAKFLVYRGLLSFAADGAVQGEIAESWERKSETQWVFKLRDALFHDGRPVTSADIKWTYEQIGAEKSTAYCRVAFQQFASIETPDPRTLVITTKQPLVTLPSLLALQHNVIAPKDSTFGHGAMPPGCGPYRLVNQERGVAMEFERFDKFYKPGLPRMKAIRMVAYPDENLRVAALQSGDVDIIEYVPWQSMDGIAANPNLKMDSTFGPFMYLAFNGKTGPFTNPLLRQAVAYSVKREDIVKSAFSGHGAPLGGLPFTKGSAYYNEATTHHWTYDPAKAKALMAKAGVPNGFKCKLLSNAQYGMHQNTAEVVQQSLASVGIEVELQLPDWATYLTLGNRGQYEFIVVGNTGDDNDPDGLSSLIDGSLSPAYCRSFGLVIPELQALLEQGRREFDPGKRREIYQKLEAVALEQAPMVGLAWRSQAYAMKKSVKGFHNIPSQLTFLSGMTLENTEIA